MKFIENDETFQVRKKKLINKFNFEKETLLVNNNFKYFYFIKLLFIIN